MRLTRKKAIELCISLWTWCAKTGKLKKDWPGWKKYGYAYLKCWFCEYSKQRQSRISRKAICQYCPLYDLFGLEGCYSPNCAYYDWKRAFDPDDRMKYAKLFLAQIKTLQ